METQRLRVAVMVEAAVAVDCLMGEKLIDTERSLVGNCSDCNKNSFGGAVEGTSVWWFCVQTCAIMIQSIFCSPTGIHLCKALLRSHLSILAWAVDWAITVLIFIVTLCSLENLAEWAFWPTFLYNVVSVHWSLLVFVYLQLS